MSKTHELTRAQLAMLASDQGEALRSAGFTASALRSAGFTASDVLSAGFTASDVLSAGFTASALRSAGFTASDVQEIFDRVPRLENPYIALRDAIHEGQRKHVQLTWGPESPPKEANICGTSMCTAGHLVNMAGKEGYALKNEFGWMTAAFLIHEKAHPDWPCQNFGNIPQSWALAFIEETAAREEAEMAAKGDGSK